ncbi:MAG: sulfotransferase [Candidatus Thermoplasmatota archaeon]
MIRVKKPIFIVGSGRCGSTIFHEMFSHHPNVSWLSFLCDSYPEKLYLNRYLMKMLNIPGLNYFLSNRIHPGECYTFWDHYCKGFSRPCRDLRSDDVTEKCRKNIIKAFEKLSTKNRNRLLIKITGWSRIGFLNEIFSDAKFIHVIRDGRAVVNSLINIGFWKGWQGPSNWRWGELSKENQKIWEKYDESFFILAAIEWKLLVESVEKGKQSLDNSRFYEIKYNDFIEHPVDSFQSVIDFCDLEWIDKFEKKIKRFNLKNMNYKWKNNIPLSQIKNLNEFLKEDLEKYGFETNNIMI